MASELRVPDPHLSGIFHSVSDPAQLRDRISLSQDQAGFEAPDTPAALHNRGVGGPGLGEEDESGS